MDLLPTSSSTEQETAHTMLFPFNDNLTTLMFIVSSDLSEAQRERLTSSFCLQGVNVTAYITHLKQKGQYVWNCSVRRKC